jgi:hypothetical protein
MRERRSKPGVQVSPLTKADFNNKVPAVPKSLFAHNTQQTAAQSVHSQNTALAAAKGVLGRIVDALRTLPEPLSAHAYSISGNMKMVEGCARHKIG